MANQRKRKPLNLKDHEEKDLTFESFIEMLTATLKVGMFAGCLYILKEIVLLANNMYFCVENHTIDIIMLELVPAGILLILACCAFWVMSKD